MMSYSSASREQGEKYAIALSKMFDTSWKNLNDRYSSNDYSDTEALILIHPAWYGGNQIQGQLCPVRGERRFKILSPPAHVECGAPELWGYRCPIAGQSLEADHRFPFSLGGPTLVTNVIWLCQAHNAAKAADWHLEVRSPAAIPWFRPLLERIRLLAS